MAMADMSVPQAHVLLLPFPAQGHINPFMQFAQFLIHNNIMVTFANTEQNHQKLNHLHSTQRLVRFVSFPDGLPPQHGRLHEFPEFVQALMKNAPSHIHKIVQDSMASEDSKVPSISAIISDGSYTFIQGIAECFRVPLISVVTCSICSYIAYFSFQFLKQQGILPLPGLSIDGDLQGIKRIWEALAAHMWPGMIMKSQDKTFAAVKSPKNEEFSDDESDYEIEYELLSNGSADPFDEFEESWVSVENSKNLTKQGSDMQDFQVIKVPSSCQDNLPETSASNTERDDSAHSTAAESTAYDSKSVTQNDSSVSQLNRENGNQEDVETEEKMDFAVEDLEQLMHEMAYMRENLRLMPDSHRREIAGRLAMKMASMFVDDKDADSV